MNTETIEIKGMCAICGYQYGYHHYETLKCPKDINGIEWADSFYADNKLLAENAEQKRLIEKIEKELESTKEQLLYAMQGKRNAMDRADEKDKLIAELVEALIWSEGFIDWDRMSINPSQEYLSALTKAKAQQ